MNKSFENHYNFTPKQAKRAVDFYREYYTDKGIFELKIYPRVTDTLNFLSSQNLRLFIGTSKPTLYAKKLLKHLRIDHFFEEIVGSNMDLTRVKKNEVIEFILSEYDLQPKEKILMVGDTQFDIEGAHICGIDSLHVGYGYGDINEVQKHTPTYSIKDESELQPFFETQTNQEISKTFNLSS